MKKLIENINDMRKSLNEISVYDLNVYSAIELYYKLALKTNEVIKELARFEGVISDEIIEQNEKLTYLLGEGLNIEVVNKINQMIADGTMDTIINHNVFNSLNNKLEHIENEINSLSNYPRINGETNDYNRFIRALSNTKEGGTLKIPSGTYVLNNNDIIINKPISIVGDGLETTILSNGGIVIESSNVQIENITVSCPTLDNAFQANTVGVSNITIRNCKGIARDHSFLFESYFGAVQHILVENCLSFNSIHGFISKAMNVTFINCKANNHPNGFGFAFISDNIPGASNVANASCNSIVNCESYLCSSGFRSYCRDKYNTSCVPRCSQNSINGLLVNSCENPVSVGEDNAPSDYKSIYQVEHLLIDGVRELVKIQDNFTIKLAKTYRCIIDNCLTLNGVTQTENAMENIIGNVLSQNKTKPHTNVLTLSTSSKILDTSQHNVFEVMLNSSTGEGDIISFANFPRNAQEVTVLVRNAGKGKFGGFDNSQCTIDTSKFNILNSEIPFNQGQISKWVYMPGITRKWLCIYASELINLG